MQCNALQEVRASQMKANAQRHAGTDYAAVRLRHTSSSRIIILGTVCCDY